MKILLKYPTRGRPQKAMGVLQVYVNLAADPSRLGLVLSCDEDDSTMTPSVRTQLNAIASPLAFKRICVGRNASKIAACNADMNIEWDWDIVVLVSDDMIPQVRGYDDAIRSHMLASFPDTDGLLWINDGFQGQTLNTLTIFGRRLYDSFGYMYHPSYTSLYSDTELTDLCKTTLKDKTLYIPHCIIRHEHPIAGFGKMDALYNKNNAFWEADMRTYISRKDYPYQWSILIPTMPGRDAQLQALLARIHEKVTWTRPEIRIDYDNRTASIGEKRQRLLQGARGKYMSFVDDDDELTDAYFEDVQRCIESGSDVMRLHGRIGNFVFTHSIDFKTGFMARLPNEFLRTPNHLNLILTDIAKLIPFKSIKRGEDLEWSVALSRLGVLRSEYCPDPSRIHYIYNYQGSTDPSGLFEYQKSHTHEEFLQYAMTHVPIGTPQRQPGMRLGPRGFVSK